MKRGDLYRVAGPPGQDPKKHRFFVVVSRNTLIATRFLTVICAPIYSVGSSLTVQPLTLQNDWQEMLISGQRFNDA